MPSRTLYADITPLEPYRLKVISTGYGPNAAKKELEAIIQRSLFNGEASGGLTNMLGSYATPPGGLPFLFDPGNSSGINYSGGVVCTGSPEVCACPETTSCVPSFALTDPQALDYVATHPPAGDYNHMLPPPEQFSYSDLPSWQQSPAALDTYIDQLRTTAQIAG